MTILTKTTIEKCLNSAFGITIPGTFLSNFKENRDMIFGVGSAISEYWHCYMIYKAHKGTRLYFGKLPQEFVNEVWLHYNKALTKSACQGGMNIICRSNTFIQFTGEDNLRIKHDGNKFAMGLAGHSIPSGRDTFYKGFSGSRYNIDKLSIKDNFEKLAKAISKDDAKKGQAFRESGGKDVDLGCLRNYMVRRACKYLLYDVVNKGGKIHYALDDINLDYVVSATPIHLKAKMRGGTKGQTGKRAKTKVPVCTSELRELFRKWNTLSPHTHFYYQMAPASPPWECGLDRHIEGWAHYAKHLIEKTVSGLGTSFNWEHVLEPYTKPVRVAFEAKNYPEVIRKFHEIPSEITSRFKGPDVERLEVKMFSDSEYVY